MTTIQRPARLALTAFGLMALGLVAACDDDAPQSPPPAGQAEQPAPGTAPGTQQPGTGQPSQSGAN
ncbi:MAG: hypothetical protein LDL26_00700 [Caenispirillum bisanense]|nr:hypothetical protein [Caenispirillum bisanense]MCA1971507.1 hypothetical protein [Caenispirillum sp.]